MTTRKGEPERVENADIEVGARVKAKRLRFREKPKSEIELEGEARTPEGHREITTSSGSERENLPKEVEPGVTYRDVEIGWQASARVEDPAADEESEENDTDNEENGSDR